MKVKLITLQNRTISTLEKKIPFLEHKMREIRALEQSVSDEIILSMNSDKKNLSSLYEKQIKLRCAYQLFLHKFCAAVSGLVRLTNAKMYR